MDRAYFLCRMQASLAMAQRAKESAARLIHLELAGRYSLAAGFSTEEPGLSHRPCGTTGSSFMLANS